MLKMEALELALAGEQNSVEIYKKLIVEHPSLQDLLYSLLNEEEKHIDLIKKKIAELYK